MAEVVNRFEVVGEFFLSGSPVETIFEPIGSVRTITIPSGQVLSGENVTIPPATLSLTGSELSLSDSNMVDLADALPEIDIQTISFNNNVLSISRGNTVDLSTMQQDLSLSGNTLSITDGTGVDLSSFDQDLSLTGTDLSITGGNTVDLSPMNQSLSVAGTDLTISDGNTVDLGFLADDLDNQTLGLTGNSLGISGGNAVDLSAFDQDLSLTGTDLSISDGNTVDLSTMQQDISLSGNDLSISNGNTVDLSAFDQELSLTGSDLSISDGNTVDLSTMQQSLSLSGTDLSITDGNTVDLSPMNQSLSFSGTDLSISDGNTVDLAALANDLDNQTLSLSGNQLTISNGNTIDLSTTQSEAVAPVFVTDVDNNNGLIERTYLAGTVPADLIVTGITVDDDSDLDITVEWDGPTDEWMGDVYINDTVISTSDISRIGNTRRFTATVNVDLDDAENISVTGNGGTHTVPVTLLGQGPEITNVTFGSLPTYGGSQQAMYLDGDDLEITATFDSTDVASISLDGGNDTATSNVTDQAVTVTDNGDGTSSVTFTATVDTSLSTTTDVPIKISAKNSFGTEGGEHTSTAEVPVRQGPEITDVTFGSYPGSQTELKDNDTISMTVTFDTNNVSQVQLSSGGSYASASQTKNVTPNTLSATTTITIDTSVTTAQNQSVRIRARGGNSNYGNYINSTETLTVNNVGATFSGFSVSYPAGQTALKDSETADVSLTISNAGSSPTYTYSDPQNQITIPDTSSYSQTKTVTNDDTNLYNISNNNFRVVVNRAENDKTTTFSSGVVKIADSLPTISISVPHSRLRSGGDENTSPQTYQVTVTSDQQLDSFDMAAAGSAGTLLGSWSGSNNNRTWTRNIQISDSDLKGTFNWASIAAVNLADSTQNAAGSGGTYTLGGFVQRSLTVSALSRTRALGTNIGDPTELTVSETFRGTITFDSTIADGSSLDADISTGVDVANKFTIVSSGALDTVDYDGDTIFYLDRVAVNNNVSGTSVITIEESV